MRKRQRGTASVPCGKCRGPTRVLKTRRDGLAVYRRRRCERCDRDFTTEERRTQR